MSLSTFSKSPKVLILLDKFIKKDFIIICHVSLLVRGVKIILWGKDWGKKWGTRE